MKDNISLQPNECWKNLNKHKNCSKCNIIRTQDNYKKGRTIWNLCFNNHVFAYFKNTFFFKSSPRSDASTQTDFSNNLDSSNKQDCSNKQDITSEQDS